MSKLFSKFIVKPDYPLSEVFSLIDKNKKGTALVQDEKGIMVGLVTDGDIRRFLMKNEDLSVEISQIMNQNFRFVTEGESREKILRLLDEKTKVLPILDKNKIIVDIVTRENFPMEMNRKVVARAKSPVRISFSGGGTDLTHYFTKHGGAVMNATIKMFSHASLRKREDNKICIHSMDLNQRVEVDQLEKLKELESFKLIAAAIELINPNFGFDLLIQSDFPMKSGLGGSSVVLSAVIGAFNEFKEDRWDNYEIAEIAFQAERISLDMAGGWQDQYATVFGGFNFMEFTKEQNVVHPLRISKRIKLELEESLVLCFTNTNHESGDIHNVQKETYQSNEDVQKLIHENRALVYEMKNMLLKNQMNNFGKSLHKTWQLKRKFSKGITNDYLDNIYDTALEHGALGGKLLGAGGGGFFLFYVDPFNKFKLTQKLESIGCNVNSIVFDDEGLQTWQMREN